MHINGNAFIARSATHSATGKVVTIRHGFNTNTGEAIVWVSITGQRTQKFTGKKSIAAVYADIDAAIASGEAVSNL